MCWEIKLVNSDPLIEITRTKRTALQKEKHTFQDKSLTLTGHLPLSSGTKLVHCSISLIENAVVDSSFVH